MPIHPDNKSRYPKDWKLISLRIRFERAGGRCECSGECGHDHGGRCNAKHGLNHPVTGSSVVLTTAHLDHTPENCEDVNLRAMCQKCHLAYDADHHKASRLRRKDAERKLIVDRTGQMQFQMDCGIK